MNDTLSSLFETIARVSARLGTPSAVVGGFVRDEFLSDTHAQDIDIVVFGNGIAFARAFDQEMKQQGRLVVFEEFDTARYLIFEKEEPRETMTVTLKQGVGLTLEKKEEPSGTTQRITLEIEFAGARAESYEAGSRKPKVASASLEEDLSRRDFTVNAMARMIKKDGKRGPLIDPFLGKKDLEAHCIRTPRDPDETFSEDPLRILRAARFSAQLGFSIEEKTKEAMHRNRARLHIVSAERIQEELMKLLATAKPSVGLWALYQQGVLDEFFEEIGALAGVEEVFGYAHKDNLSHTFAVVDNIADRSDKPLLRFAGLVHDIAKPRTKKFIRGRGWTFDMHEHLGKKMVQEIGRRLKMSLGDIQYVAKLVRWHLQPIALMDKEITDSAVRRLIVSVGDDLPDLLILCRADITTGNQKKKERRLGNYDRLEERITFTFEKDNLRAFQSPVRGEEIMEICGLKAGPTVGRIKKAIEEAILEGAIPNEYQAAKAHLPKIQDEYIEKAEEWELDINS